MDYAKNKPKSALLCMPIFHNEKPGKTNGRAFRSEGESAFNQRKHGKTEYAKNSPKSALLCM